MATVTVVHRDSCGLDSRMGREGMGTVFVRAVVERLAARAVSEWEPIPPLGPPNRMVGRPSAALALFGVLPWSSRAAAETALQEVRPLGKDLHRVVHQYPRPSLECLTEQGAKD